MKRTLTTPERATVQIHDILSVAIGHFSDGLDKLQAEGNFNIEAVSKLLIHHWVRTEDKLKRVAEAMGTRGAIDVIWQAEQWEKANMDPDTILNLLNEMAGWGQKATDDDHITPVEIEMLLRHTPEEVEMLMHQQD